MKIEIKNPQLSDQLLTITFYPSVDSIRWSFEIAKMIMHYPHANARKIICIQSSQEWVKDTGNPIVQFKETYLNTDSKPLRINIFYAVCGNKSYHERLYHDTISTHSKLSGDSKWSSVVIPPVEKSEISGTLNWFSVSTKEYMPQIIFTQDEDALYNAETIEGDLASNEPYDYCPNDFKMNDPKAILENSIVLFRNRLDQSIYNLFTGEWKSLGAGFGLNQTGKLLFYRSVLRFPFSVDNKVMLVTDNSNFYIPSGFIDVSFYQGPDKNYAFNKFDKILSILRDHFGPTQYWEESKINEEGYRHDMETTLKNKAVNIKLNLRQLNNEWLVNMYIENKLKTYSMSKLLPERLAPIENPGGAAWLDEIIHDRTEGFKNIQGELKKKSADEILYKLNIDLPKYVYSSQLSNSILLNRTEVRLFLCQSDDHDKCLRQFDSLKTNILASLKKQNIKYSIDDPNSQDSNLNCKIFLNSEVKNTQEDINLVMRSPFLGGLSKDYFLALRFYFYNHKR